ncbi:hypothetical protein JVU11DRAFT_10134 [Chiua virens]|nr:hypothetical protein JVU11DRAFT_10134 [Chiua virens]
MSVPIASCSITEGPVTLPKAWTDALTEFTANQIPIHLIDLQTLRLVSRSDVARHYRLILAAYLQKHPSRQNAPQHEITRTIFKIVKYAIFSHRWLAEGEPTFQDMSMISTFAEALSRDDETVLAQTLVTHVPDIATRAGLHKFLLFCSKARSYHCRFAWSDTCCIHKDSSAELDESIRAMFRWYHNAYVCIVHLASSLASDDIPTDEWFTRGWTLQELIAPESIKFYNREWRAFTDARNDKDRRNDTLPLEKRNPVWLAILRVTNIPPGRLSYFSPGAFDVAQRLSWAAGRRTTRIEDVAYALVGIFEIHMPVQYGEGRFAFQRLMEALLLRVQAYDIFIWTGPPSQYSAALPVSIEGYLVAREAENCISVPNEFGDPSMMLTHKGLQVEVLLVPVDCREAADEHIEDERDSDSEETESEKHNDQDESRSGSDPDDDDELGVRFLGNDVESQSTDQGRFSWFHFTDSGGVFRPLSVRGSGPIVFVDDIFTYPDIPPRQYAFAILDYHRDWERGSGCVYVPYSQKSKYLAFVLYRDEPGEVWHKLQTNTLVYVQVEDEKMYEGKTVNICL